MNIQGKIISILPTQSGKSAKGEWFKYQFVIEIPDDKFSKHAVFATFNKEIGESLQPMQEVDVHFDIDAREYQGRWFTDLKAWKVDVKNSVHTKGTGTGKSSTETWKAPETPSDELPF